MKTAKFKIKKSEDGQYYFTLVGKNGKVLMTSETYVKKSNAKAGVKAAELLFIDPLTGIDIADETLKK